MVEDRLFEKMMENEGEKSYRFSIMDTIILYYILVSFFFSSRRRHTRWNCDWSSDVCSSDLWNVGAFGRVDINGQNVFTIEIDVGSQLEREGRVATPVFTKPHAVNPNRGGSHHAFKISKDMAPTCFRRKFETATVEGHKLVRLIVEAVPRQWDVGVRNDNALKSRVVKILLMPSVNNRPVVAPIAVDRKDHAATRNGVGLPNGVGEGLAR